MRHDESLKPIRSGYEPTSGVAPVFASVDESTLTARPRPLPHTIAPNGHNRIVASLDSSPPDTPGSQGRMGPSFDNIPDPGPDLLKVIVDVTNYLRGIPLGELHPQISFCQWKILQLFVARLDEVPKADFRVMLVDTDALRNKYADHYVNVRVTQFGRSDDTFDQLLRPLLDWRRSEPTGHVMSAWVADFKALMQYGCKSVACPCEKYLETLRPYGDCVTALQDYSDPGTGHLSFVAGDKIRLISRTDQITHDWEGQCIRTGQTGTFFAFAYA